MADRERVIKGLEICEKKDCVLCPYTDWCGEYDDIYYNCTKLLAKDVLALLKEQDAVTPKQIIRKQCKKEHEDGSIDYFAEWYCPHCNLLILRGFDNPSIKFCYKCGKPILWEGR